MTKEALQRVDASFQLRYRVSVHDLDITDTPGYWQEREPRMHPRHPLHGCLGFEGPFRATYTYHDSPRDSTGRFASTTRTWSEIRSGTQEGTT